MLSLCNENFSSFCVIMLLLWFDFHINIPCLCYDNLLILPCLYLSSWYSSRNCSQIYMKYPSCLNPPYLTLHRGVKTLQYIYWFSLLQKPAKIHIICILNFNVSLCWLVGGKSHVFPLIFAFHLLVV